MAIESALTSIDVIRNGPRLDIVLANPEVRNRLASPELAELIRILERVNQDVSIQVLTLTGQGDCFCGGFDLNELTSFAEQARLPDFDKLADKLEALRCPTIAALNGGAYGGAIELALACDFRVGATGCEILMPAAKIGLHYYPDGLARYVAKLGVAVTKRLFLAAEKFDDQSLLDIEFLDQLVEPAKLAEAVDGFASRIQALAPLPVEGMKQAINAHALQQDTAALEANYRKVLASDDFKEGILALNEKRRPNFQRK